MERPLAAAVWHDGKSAAARHVYLALNPLKQTLQVLDAEGAVCSEWPLEALKELSGSLNSPSVVPIRLGMKPDTGERLVLNDAPSSRLVSEWSAGPLQQSKNRALRKWLVGTVAVWALAVGLYFATPAIFNGIAMLLPQSWEEAVGESANGKVLKALEHAGMSDGVNEAATKSPELARLMRKLVEAQSVEGYGFTVTVIDASFVNAFALPGGYIVVTTGLVKDCRSSDELAGVLGHEMAHVIHRHGTSGQLRSMAWSTVLSFVGGRDSSIAGDAAAALVTGGFDRDDEREADRDGTVRIEKAGIDPSAIAQFFRRAMHEDGDRGGLFSYIASHPDNAERVANVETQAKELAARRAAGTTYGPAMRYSEWKAFRAACGIK